MRYRIDFIDVFDALIDSMLDHGTDTKNQKTSATLHENAPTKIGTSAALHGNAFRVSWFSWVPPRAPQAIAPNIHFQVSFCDFCSSGLICWPLPACTQVENMQYRIDFIDVFDALIDSMLDHGTLTKNQKTSATLHENAPAKIGTSTALHELSLIHISEPTRRS